MSSIHELNRAISFLRGGIEDIVDYSYETVSLRGDSTAIYKDSTNAQMEELMNNSPSGAGKVYMDMETAAERPMIRNNKLAGGGVLHNTNSQQNMAAGNTTVYVPAPVASTNTSSASKKGEAPKLITIKFDPAKTVVYPLPSSSFIGKAASSSILSPNSKSKFPSTKPSSNTKDNVCTTSGISIMLKAAAEVENKTKSSLLSGSQNNVKVKVYLPNSTYMAAVLVSDSTTVEGVIKEVIRYVNDTDNSIVGGSVVMPNRLHANSEYYELRLHDEDEGEGVPDEDCPALERKKKIVSFQTSLLSSQHGRVSPARTRVETNSGGSDGGGSSPSTSTVTIEASFCLCEIPGLSISKPPLLPLSHNRSISTANDVLRIRRRGGSGSVTETNSSGSSLLSNPHNVRFIKIISSEDNEQYSTISVTSTMCVKDMLPILEKRKRLITGKEYTFIVNDTDKARLNLLTNELDMAANIFSLNIESATLSQKIYADSPATILNANASKNKGLEDKRKIQANMTITNSHYYNTYKSEERPDLDSFMFNDHTAAILQEWVVIKINARGKRQERIMGVDSTFIHNRRTAESSRSNRGLSAVARAFTGGLSERAIKDIVDVRFLPSNVMSFRITFKEGSGDDTLSIDYEAQSARDAAEIVAKILYIQRHLLL